MSDRALLPNKIVRPQALIQVSEGERRSGIGAIHCAIGHNLVFDASRLSEWFFCDLPERVEDLITLIGATAFADRIVVRRPDQGWGRDIEVALPVHDPDFWCQVHVKDALADTLDFLSGDCWNFSFRKRAGERPRRTQRPLPFSLDRFTIVMPYSDGLDSLAVARLQHASASQADIVQVTTGQYRDVDRDWRHWHGRIHKLSIPFELAGHRLRETSYRTRGFVFNLMAGIAAHLSGARTIVVSESGQGALGPWMMPVGNETPDVRTHPLFTRKLEALIGAVLGSLPRFEHPRLWHTKGETLRRLAVLDRAAPWAGTRSCGRGARCHVHLGGRLAQCGVCGACLLRRQSLLAAGLNEGDDRYLWRDLGATTLAGAASPGARLSSQNDERHGVCGALSLARFASLAASGVEVDRCIHRASGELAEVLVDTPQQIEARLRRLIASHRNEWQAFVAQAGPGSLLAKWTSTHPC